MRTLNGNCASRNLRIKFAQYIKILFLVVLFSTICFIFLINYSADLFFNKKELYHENYVINTEGCRIPAMELDKKLMEKYIKYPKKLKPCPHANYSLVEQNGTHIWFVYDAKVLKHYKIKYKNRKNIVCCYSAFFRPDYIRNINDNGIDNRIEYEKCIYFKDIIEVNDEFVRVQCFYGYRLLHDQFFIFVPLKQLKYNDEEKKHINKTVIKPAFNVLIIGVDNMSRLNFYRTMPKTAGFMKSRGAVELKGYNKVGDNSFPNLVPLLMGYSANEIKKICHPMPTSTFDDCPFLWHWYKDAGYYTAYGEDSGFLGTFNYASLKGFRKSPTDYYLHPFVTEAEKVAGNSQDYNVKLCMNEFYLYQILLDYIQALTVTLKDSKLFGFFWETTMSHDALNYPIAMDESYLRFFEALEKTNYLNKTIIFLMSDHGIRWGAFRKTKQGYLEERLPLAQILLPPSFRENYTEAYNNLKYNSRQLTTPFDMHETLYDLLDLENIQNESILERVGKKNVEDRGISLFLKVPSNRTCKSADIDDQWCTCHRRVEVSNTSEIVVSATGHLITHLNVMLVDYPQCARLELDMVQQAEKITLDNTKDLAEDWKEFSVKVKVKPSGGVFEATLRHDGSSWSVRGDVSRLNLYGDQSVCVNDARIKLYCYCKQTKTNDEQIPSVTTMEEDK